MNIVCDLETDEMSDFEMRNNPRNFVHITLLISDTKVKHLFLFGRG